MPTLESLTVPQLAALCGLTASSDDGTRLSAAWDWNVNDWRGITQHKDGQWRAYVGPLEHGPLCWADSKHAALVALAKHLNLTPENPVKYKRIDRDPKTDDYVDYTPKAGDRWHFGRGEPWTVYANGHQVGPSMEPRAHGATCFILAHTTHIERPVKVIDVRGPGYEPQVGDVFCGPDGPVISIVSVTSDYIIFDDGSGTNTVRAFDRLTLLAARIEREE